MPLLPIELLPGSSGENVGELHSQLVTLGVPIAAGEKSTKKFGPSTVAAVRDFRQRYGLAAADSVDRSVGRLMHVASVFSTEDNRPALRAAVREVAAAPDAPPQELYWLARFAILARDYETAHAIALRIPGHDGIPDIIEPILAPPDLPTLPDPRQPPAAPQPRPPEVPYPENFYSYRRPWVDPAALERVASDWPNLTDQNHNPLQHNGGPPAIAALKYWDEGNKDFDRRRYADAIAAYDNCQDSVIAYFDKFYLDIEPSAGNRTDRLEALIKRLYALRESRLAFWNFFQRRRELLALAELDEHDRIVPGDTYASALNFVSKQMGDPSDPADPIKDFRERNLDAPLVTLAFVLVPLARAEANRARRQYDAALRDLQWVLNSVFIRRTLPTPANPDLIFIFARLACEFIELPFAKVLLVETMLDKADTEYKARIAAEPSPAPDVTAFQGLKAAQTYLAIKDQFRNEGEYVKRVDDSRDRLTQQIQQRITANDTRSPAFQLLGKDILVPTLTSFSTTLPGLDRRAKTHEPLLKFTLPEGQTVMRETNPRVYAALLTATARLEQLKAGFNYLGYLDSYVPPWRFQFLLERARYFAEHAKSAQRDYLNFLSNAEREDFQELSTAQNVEMEKSNVSIETARVDQVGLEVAAAQESANLAFASGENAGTRLNEYKEFDKYMDDKESDSFWGSVVGGIAMVGIAALGAAAGPAVLLSVAGAAAVGGAVVKGASDVFNKDIENSKANEQRELEKKNLERAEAEARQAAQVARAQLEVAKAGLVVAGLQRQAALLRHEFALQNLEFLRNRVLNAEQWYRLVAAIRSVSETYLRYSVELAFLAEQAYEFEADKRINVVRFDYDLSEVGNFLAADFLMRDLDTLEQDLIVTQRQRQQQVRYVLSMAREFPEALQEIRDNGKTMFSLRLEQLEKRFPGLYNLRIGAVDVLPVALMDSTRFSLELTHLGTSQVRLKAQPDTEPGVPSLSPLNQDDLAPFLFAAPAQVFADELDQGTFSDQFRKQFTNNGVNIPSTTDVTPIEPGLVWRLSSIEIDEEFLVRKKQEELYVYLIEVDDDWLRDIRDEWPVKLRVTGPETAVFSGLTRQDANAVFAFATTGQRHAFEALGAAAAWQVDFTARDNQVVPGTLADLLITFTVSGYHDSGLRKAIDAAKPQTTALTSFLSARQIFPDAFYDFNRTGRMVWKVPRELLALNGDMGRLRNIGMSVRPGVPNVHFSRLMTRLRMNFRINDSGGVASGVSLFTVVPETSVTQTAPLTVAVRARLDAATELAWDFGDGTPILRTVRSGTTPIAPAEGAHTYAKPGRYVLKLRSVQNDSLSEFRIGVVVSRNQKLGAPLIVWPRFAAFDTTTKTITITTGGDVQQAGRMLWRVGDALAEGNSATFTLKPGHYTLDFAAVRRLNFRAYGAQRYVNDLDLLPLQGLSATTNRTFNENGQETNGTVRNKLAKRLFNEGAISPEDDWTFELIPEEILGVPNGTAIGAEELDLSEIQDVVLSMEYDITPSGPL